MNMEIYAQSIQNMISPEKDHPKWEKRCIKRKYGPHPAEYLDVWIPYQLSLWDTLPKQPWRRP